MSTQQCTSDIPSPTIHVSNPETEDTVTFDQLPEPLPIVFTKEELKRTSQEEQELTKTLKDHKQVIQTNSHLSTEKTITRLALKLAHQSFFGARVLSKCTVMGEQGLPGLPRSELVALKIAIFQQLPKYWNEKKEFESIWNMCVTAINGACRRERYKTKPHE